MANWHKTILITFTNMTVRQGTLDMCLVAQLQCKADKYLLERDKTFFKVSHHHHRQEVSLNE